MNLIKNKLQKKDEQKKPEKKSTSIEKINEQIKSMDALFDEEDVSIKYEPNPMQNRLLKMLYLDDVDAEYVKNNLSISDSELEHLVNQLVKIGLIDYTSDDEVELTNEGIYYIVNRDLDLL